MIDIPANQPLSADIIDRRNGQTPTLAEKVRDLMIKIHDDWQDSMSSNSKSSDISPQDATVHPNDATAISQQVHKVLNGDALSSDSAQRIRAKVNNGR